MVKTTPVIYTDSKALKWLETANLSGNCRRETRRSTYFDL